MLIRLVLSQLAFALVQTLLGSFISIRIIYSSFIGWIEKFNDLFHLKEGINSIQSGKLTDILAFNVPLRNLIMYFHICVLVQHLWFLKISQALSCISPKDNYLWSNTKFYIVLCNQLNSLYALRKIHQQPVVLIKLERQVHLGHCQHDRSLPRITLQQRPRLPQCLQVFVDNVLKLLLQKLLHRFGTGPFLRVRRQH